MQSPLFLPLFGSRGGVTATRKRDVGGKREGREIVPCTRHVRSTWRKKNLKEFRIFKGICSGCWIATLIESF